MAETNIQQWGGWDLDQAAREAELIEAASASEFLKTRPGRNVFRFLPGPPGRSPFRVSMQHYIDVPGAQSAVNFMCPRFEKKSPCPVCAYAEKLRRNGNPADRKRAYDLFAKVKVFACVVDRAAPEPVVRVFGFGQMIHDSLKTIREDPDGGGDFTNPTGSGFDVIIKKSGTGRETEYEVIASRAASPLHDDPATMQALLDQRFDLETYVKVPTEEEIMDMIGDVSVLARGAAKPGDKPQRGRAPAAQQVSSSASPPRTAAADAEKVIDVDADEEPF